MSFSSNSYTVLFSRFNSLAVFRAVCCPIKLVWLIGDIFLSKHVFLCVQLPHCVMTGKGWMFIDCVCTDRRLMITDWQFTTQQSQNDAVCLYFYCSYCCSSYYHYYCYISSLRWCFDKTAQQQKLKGHSTHFTHEVQFKTTKPAKNNCIICKYKL